MKKIGIINQGTHLRDALNKLCPPQIEKTSSSLSSEKKNDLGAEMKAWARVDYHEIFV